MQFPGRMLYVGWFNANPYQSPANTLSLPRDVTYEGGELLVRPVTELKSLREEVLASVGKTTLSPQATLPILGSPSTSFDLELEVALTDSPLSFGVSVMAAAGALDAEVIVKIHVGPPDQTTRLVNVSAEVPLAGYHREAYNTSFVFAMPTAETAMSVRILADRSIVETFVADGRGVVTSAVLSPGANPNRTGVIVFGNQTGVTLNSAKAWAMGCGWA